MQSETSNSSTSTTSTETQEPEESEESDESGEPEDAEPVEQPEVRQLNRKPRAAGDLNQRLCGQKVGILIDVSGSTAQQKPAYKDALRRVGANLAGTGSTVGVQTFASNAPAKPNGGFSARLLDPAGKQAFDSYIDRLDGEWPQGDTQRSDYQRGLASVQNQGYDVVILIGDGYMYNDPPRSGYLAGTYSAPVFEAINISDAMRSSGTRVLGVRVNEDVQTARVFNSAPVGGLRTLNQLFPDAQAVPAGFSRISGSEVVIFNNKFQKPRSIRGSVGSREGLHSNGRWLPLYTQWQFDSPAAYLGRLTDTVVGSNYGQLADELDKLTSGCVGTITIHKEIVDANGRVDTRADTGGFTFRADRALVNGREQQRVQQSTGGDGATTFNFPVTKNGTTSIAIEEVLGGNSPYRLRPQDAPGGQKATAICQVRNAGSSAPISYGSGSGRVVKSEVNNKKFTITGLRDKDIVDCTVQNTAGTPEFNVSKSAVPQPRVITGNGQEFKAAYQVDVRNTGTVEGTPAQIKEIPSAPKGLSILRVEVQNPNEVRNSLIQRPGQLSKSGPAWVLPEANMRPIPAKQTRSVKVNVVYRVNNVGNIPENLTCPSGGLKNRVELSGNKRADACVSMSRPAVSVNKFLNGEDADTRESASSTTGAGQTTVRYTIRNDGSTPLTAFTIADAQLDPNTSRPNGKIRPTGLSCDRNARVVQQGDTVRVVPAQALAPRGSLSCTWRSDRLAAAPGDYHANRATIMASFNVPEDQKVNQNAIGPVSATDDAWMFTLPILNGDLPLTGGKGVWPLLLAGASLALAGGLALRRAKA
ncbi:hypothetical protein CCICO_10110 [Corynebacterium ciconiae DSM 44920]|uniref:vWA domain-containing protein n=1 Tax=Corynebacterium ciconiae TaxID=227319 RepID=UPI0003A80969|nr:vWA domain-containing protein [Corynebacterium ciconiae]WKD62021.1 hypothetical protein CCICO_10110 [Corynebacterium ciconiae DSM 44920]